MTNPKSLFAVSAITVAILSPGLAGAQAPPAPAAPPAAVVAPEKKTVEMPPLPVKKVVKEALKVGDMAPDFELATMDGKQFKLSAHLAASKKPAVFIVGQSACTNCRSEVMFVNSEAPKNAAVDFFIINVDAIGNTEKGKEMLGKYFASIENKLPVLIDPKMAVPRQFGVRATPGMFIIGKDGKFLQTDTGYVEDDAAELAEKFKKIQ
jgi:peroxiredoxin